MNPILNLFQKRGLSATLAPCLSFLLFFMGSTALWSQKALQLTGRVVDQKLETPIPFAAVVVKSLSNQSLVAGTTTDVEGYFSLEIPSRSVTIEVSSLGYQLKRIPAPEAENGLMAMGTIFLEEDAQTLEEVEVTAERSRVEFKLDKRVFNVGQDLASTGLGALDVLSNVPSVNVDIEGNVRLRGNSGVQILINGKPSVLSDEGGTALSTITADMIERIEVITNPSAKYEAEGSSGIINIVLKKEEKKGLNGSISLNTGVPANHSIGGSLNRRTEHFNFFTQFGGGYRSLPSYRKSSNFNKVDSTEVRSKGVEYRNERFANITLGADYYLNQWNVFTLSGSYAYEDEDQPSETDFDIYRQGVLESRYRRTEVTSAGNPKYQYDLQYQRQFQNHEDHVLQFSTLGNFFGKEQTSSFENRLLEGISLNPDQRTETRFFQRDYIHKLDYTRPMSDWKLEAGAQFESNDVGNDYAVYNATSDGFQLDSTLTNDFRFQQEVLGVYLTTALEKERWGVQLGGRIEQTLLQTALVTTGEENKQAYRNFFPSAHASFKWSEQLSFQVGFSKRIYRPRLWDLNPFFNIRNNYNIRMGNPNLQPELADSYEMTGIWVGEKFSMNMSVYHLTTTDVIERVTLFQDNVSIVRPENIGIRQQSGIEWNGKYSPLKWLSINGDFNYGFFMRRGQFDEQSFDFTGTQWFTRWTGRAKLPYAWELEVSGEYQSPFANVQGEVSGFAFMDIGVRKKVWKGKMVVNLGVRDLLASRIQESVADQAAFNAYSFSQRGRFITLGVSYSIGKGEAMEYSGRRR